MSIRVILSRRGRALAIFTSIYISSFIKIQYIYIYISGCIYIIVELVTIFFFKQKNNCIEGTIFCLRDEYKFFTIRVVRTNIIILL